MLRAAGTAIAAAAALVAVAIASAVGGSPATQVVRTSATGVCPFPLQITVTRKPTGRVSTTVLQYRFAGPSTITLRNAKTGRTAKLVSPGPYAVNTKTGSVSFTGHQVWFWSTGENVPFLSTQGAGSIVAPYNVFTPAASTASVIDPCALVAGSNPSTKPRTTKSSWGLPAYALSQIRYADLIPDVGALVRHDHVHLDILANGRKVTIPAGIGLVGPFDTGPCPPGSKLGDCATGHVYFAKAAVAPIHTHSTSGLIHIESDRKGTYTLGQFFDEWGVRLDASCLGGYCAGGGLQLRAYVNGKRVADPRGIVLGNRQEIALVYGGKTAFRSVPSKYTGGWPGQGCGGTGEHSCFP
ncbi:MAG TPA: hypothetical protein VH063_19575 [Gaiellaceae bacterium]|jgi:hypothetical protein|nr:hypothetical protein [Gaiellaceae bacterium]